MSNSNINLHTHRDYTRPPQPQYSPRMPYLAQVGWIGQTGAIYALNDEPRDGREKGSWQPLLIQLGEYKYNESNEDYELRED